MFSLHNTRRSLGDTYSLSYSLICRWYMFKVMVLVERQEKGETQKIIWVIFCFFCFYWNWSLYWIRTFCFFSLKYEDRVFVLVLPGLIFGFQSTTKRKMYILNHREDSTCLVDVLIETHVQQFTVLMCLQNWKGGEEKGHRNGDN